MDAEQVVLKQYIEILNKASVYQLLETWFEQRAHHSISLLCSKETMTEITALTVIRSHHYFRELRLLNLNKKSLDEHFIRHSEIVFRINTLLQNNSVNAALSIEKVITKTALTLLSVKSPVMFESLKHLTNMSLYKKVDANGLHMLYRSMNELNSACFWDSDYCK